LTRSGLDQRIAGAGARTDTLTNVGACDVAALKRSAFVAAALGNRNEAVAPACNAVAWVRNLVVADHFKIRNLRQKFERPTRHSDVAGQDPFFGDVFHNGCEWSERVCERIEFLRAYRRGAVQQTDTARCNQGLAKQDRMPSCHVALLLIRFSLH
jgi:hypothetical protein